MATASQTMVRVYKDNDEYRRDAEKLARDGWIASNVTERRPRAGCARIVLLGIFSLVRPPKPELVVTYQRTSAVAAPAVPFVITSTQPTAPPNAFAGQPGHCPSCGAAVNEKTWFCPNCRTQLRR